MKKRMTRRGLKKEPVDASRIRKMPTQFEPLDRRLLYEKHLCWMTIEQMALYMFLALASDAQGLSYYSSGKIAHLLRMDEPAVCKARQDLINKQFLLYHQPMYQLLDLPEGPRVEPNPPRRKQNDTLRKQNENEARCIGDVLRNLMEGT